VLADRIVDVLTQHAPAADYLRTVGRWWPTCSCLQVTFPREQTHETYAEAWRRSLVHVAEAVAEALADPAPVGTDPVQPVDSAGEVD
jgi:hypothetical protein